MVQSALAMEVPSLLAGWLDRLDATGRWALLKLLTGALRVGVSARLAKTALAEWSGHAAHGDRGSVARARATLPSAVRLALRHRPAARGRRSAGVQAANAVASDRGQGVARYRADGLRGGMEVGRHSGAGGASRGREAPLFAHRRRYLGRFSRRGRGASGRRRGRRRIAGDARTARSLRSTTCNSGSTGRP